jgi:subtilisin family serine protease
MASFDEFINSIIADGNKVKFFELFCIPLRNTKTSLKSSGGTHGTCLILALSTFSFICISSQSFALEKGLVLTEKLQRLMPQLENSAHLKITEEKTGAKIESYPHIFSLITIGSIVFGISNFSQETGSTSEAKSVPPENENANDVEKSTPLEEPVDDGIAEELDEILPMQPINGEVGLGSYRNTAEGNFLTEYNYNSMLSSINPLSLNDYGYTGSGINVSVVDTGVDARHQEFDDKIILGYDFGGSSSGFQGDEVKHGTHVASIIVGERDEAGMRGVAYDASLFSYKLSDDTGAAIAITTDASTAAVFNQHITDNIKVSNNSWGTDTKVTALSSSSVLSDFAQTRAVIKAAQNNGTLFVFSAGNNGYTEVTSIGGLPYHDPMIAEAWLVVVAVDSKLTETGYTNNCGVAADFCVAAPGGGDNQSTEGILAAEANTTDGYIRYSGTSMAAPHVSGVAAALMQKFPNLTPAQIATRIKSTASLESLTGYNGETLEADGETVMSAIFGYGYVNSEAASSQIGNFLYAQGNNLDGARDLSSNKVALPAGLNALSLSKIMSTDFIVFDSFDGAVFTVSGAEVFEQNGMTFVPLIKTQPTQSGLTDNALFLTSTENAHKISDNVVLSFSSGGHFDTLASHWEGKANLFQMSPHDTTSPKMRLEALSKYEGFDFSYFATVAADFDGDHQTDYSEIGVSLKQSLQSKTDLLASISFANAPLAIGFDGIELVAQSTKMQLGLIKNMNDGLDMFMRYEQTHLQDVSATHASFGSEDLKADSILLGLEKTTDSETWVVGAKTNYDYSAGEISLFSPAGMNPNGEVFFDQKRFEVEADRKLKPFLSYSVSFQNSSVGLGLVSTDFEKPELEALQFNYAYFF